jgi:hypothetical protein
VETGADTGAGGIEEVEIGSGSLASDELTSRLVNSMTIANICGGRVFWKITMISIGDG